MEEQQQQDEALYDFDAPQFADFADDGEWMNEEADDDFFVTRDSMAGLENVPEEWMAQLSKPASGELKNEQEGAEMDKIVEDEENQDVTNRQGATPSQTPLKGPKVPAEGAAAANKGEEASAAADVEEMVVDEYRPTFAEIHKQQQQQQQQKHAKVPSTPPPAPPSKDELEASTPPERMTPRSAASPAAAAVPFETKAAEGEEEDDEEDDDDDDDDDEVEAVNQEEEEIVDEFDALAINDTTPAIGTPEASNVDTPEPLVDEEQICQEDEEEEQEQMMREDRTDTLTAAAEPTQELHAASPASQPQPPAQPASPKQPTTRKAAQGTPTRIPSPMSAAAKMGGTPPPPPPPPPPQLSPSPAQQETRIPTPKRRTQVPTPPREPQAREAFGANKQTRPRASSADLRRDARQRSGQPRPSSASRPDSPSFMRPTANATERLRQSRRGSHSASGRGVPGKLTEPQTPKLSTAMRPRREAPPSTTTLQLQRTEKERLRLRQDMQRRKQVFARSKAPANRGPVANVQKKALTAPASPAFVSSQRPGAVRAMQQKQSADAARPTATRNQPVRPSQQFAGPTHPEPFKLATDDRLRSRANSGSTASADTYEPLAVQVERFQKETPARFRTGSKRGQGPQPAPHHPLRLTKPSEPRFASDARLRGAHGPTAEQREEQELRGVQPFKARPVSRKVLESSGDLGVPKVEKQAPCVPVAFNFASDKRAGRKSMASSQAPAPQRSRRASSGPVGRRPHLGSVGSANSGTSRPSLTEARPFQLATDQRALSRPSAPAAPAEAAQAKPFVARLLPDFSKPPALPQAPKPQLVAPEPFKLESERRHEEAQRLLREQRERELLEEEEARKFKARPIMKPKANAGSPAPTERPLTNPKTPTVLQRSLVWQEQNQNRLRQQQENEARQIAFAALPLPRTTFEKTWSPKLPHRACGSLDIKLNSDLRALERAKFEEQNAERQRILEEERRREQERRAEEERRATLEFRKSLVFKANPVPDYSEMAGGLSRPVYSRLTEPESPNLATSRRGGRRGAGAGGAQPGAPAPEAPAPAAMAPAPAAPEGPARGIPEEIPEEIPERGSDEEGASTVAQPQE